MKLWRFTEPFDHRFARASRVGGTWQGAEYKVRSCDILIEWEPGSDVVGDFTWPGLDTDLIVTDRVGIALRDIPGFELRCVMMQENTGAAKRRSKKPRVQLPYQGPPLWDFWVSAWIAMNREHSAVNEIVRDDGSCDFKILGAQRQESGWNLERMEHVSVLHPRVEGQGVFVPSTQGVFRVEEFPAWIFCTDDVKMRIEECGLTNVSFLEMGEVLGTL